MEESNANIITKEPLVDLYKYYESINRSELEFFFKYFNFYIGLLSALLAGTLTGFLSFKKEINSYEAVLLLGPVLIILLSYLSYRIISVYYRRSLEAWVTVYNIKNMLGYVGETSFEKDISPPIFTNIANKSFIVQFYRKNTSQIFDDGKKNNWTADEVLSKLVSAGDTLKYAKYTLAIFSIAGLILACCILHDLIHSC